LCREARSWALRAREVIVFVAGGVLPKMVKDGATVVVAKK